MSKKRNATTVSDASDGRDEALETEVQEDGSVKAVPLGTAQNATPEIHELEDVITDDDLVTEPEAEPVPACEKCTADVVDGVCVNCGTEA